MKSQRIAHGDYAIRPFFSSALGNKKGAEESPQPLRPNEALAQLLEQRFWEHLPVLH
jgi:hypothetical protein